MADTPDHLAQRLAWWTCWATIVLCCALVYALPRIL